MKRGQAGAGANPYHDTDLARFYAGLGFEGTYALVARDLPAIIDRHVKGLTALDFACGAGRSTRFLKQLGFDVVGVDVSQNMLAEAKRRDRNGTYLEVGNNDLSSLAGATFDLVLAAYPFDSTASLEAMTLLLGVLRDRLAPQGRLILIDSTDALYRHEWLTFTTAAYPENATARSGDPVRIAFRDRPGQPVVDTLWTDGDYRRAFNESRLDLLETHRTLAGVDDEVPWISERTLAPWVIYVLAA